MKANTDNKLLLALNRFQTGPLDALSGALGQMEAAFGARFGGAANGSMDSFIHDALTGGGKRLRPILLYLCSGFGDSAHEDTTVRLMQAIELIHAASLVHDDIIDHSPLRHGKPTINAEKGDGYAARCGFAMVSEAVKLLGDFEENGIVALFAGIPMEMCRGELLQIDVEGHPALQSVAEYYKRIEKKTAELIEGSCRVGGLLCRAKPDVMDALSRYGRALGILFQLRDDLLDYDTAPGDGKPVAQDIERGIYSLPLLCTLERARGGPAGDKLLRVMEKKDKGAEDICYLLAAAHTYGGVEYTREAIGQEAKRARDALAALPPGGHRDLLGGLLELLAPNEREKPAPLQAG